MFRFAAAVLIVLAILSTNCTADLSGTGSTPTSPVSTEIVSTASVGTVEPEITTPLPLDYTPPPTLLSPTQTPIPTLSAGSGPTELKYRLLSEFPDFFYCDPDYYPVGRDDEALLALQRFPEIQANAEEFETILAHNNMAGKTTFSDQEKLLIYREHKKLAALVFELGADFYRFQMQVAKTEGEGQLISGQIDGQGAITVLEKTASIATCPICLAVGTRIDTPQGPVPVQSLRPGMLVWTMDESGRRVVQPLLRVGKTVVPASHQVVHILLEDGREVWVSPGHPMADDTTVADLQVGESLGGSLILSVQRVSYAGQATYDLLPGGETGFYWANGILLASTLK